MMTYKRTTMNLLYHTQLVPYLHHLNLMIYYNKEATYYRIIIRSWLWTCHIYRWRLSHGTFLEKSGSDSKVCYFKVDSKSSYLYHKSIVYTFAQFTKKKNEFFIKNCGYFEIINFVEHTGMTSLSSLWFYVCYSSFHWFCWYLVL